MAFIPSPLTVDFVFSRLAGEVKSEQYYHRRKSGFRLLGAKRRRAAPQLVDGVCLSRRVINFKQS